MLKPTGAVLGAALLLAACEDGTPERNVASVRAANPYSDRLKGMSELYRNLGLRRSILDSGQRCKKVDRGAHQEDYRNMAMWVAHCTDSGDWAIFIASNGDAQVRACSDAAALKLPACRPAPSGAPVPKRSAG